MTLLKSSTDPTYYIPISVLFIQIFLHSFFWRYILSAEILRHKSPPIHYYHPTPYSPTSRVSRSMFPVARALLYNTSNPTCYHLVKTFWLYVPNISYDANVWMAQHFSVPLYRLQLVDQQITATKWYRHFPSISHVVAIDQ